ncbi:MAG: sugar ABC transporter substrate-binding protein, partial [Lachnospiraceae bacterium]|nr:sugar ABC transporter substrate-binding protein [Lachnospiraceae bacterium]
MKLKKVAALLLSFAMMASVLAGCGAAADTSAPAADGGAAATTDGGSGDTAAATPGEVTEFTMFITMPGSEINDDNEIAQMIADKWGVKVKETWLTGQTASEATGTLVAGGEYPDFIDSDEMNQLVDADALVPLDDYIDQYPEFRDLWFTPEEWEKFRQPDGHIYW